MAPVIRSSHVAEAVSVPIVRVQQRGEIVARHFQTIVSRPVAKPKSRCDQRTTSRRARGIRNPRQGFYVVVPPQYASWGAPPPAWYIDALMHHEAGAYYVGLLKAAELHGATHQAVMEFQVISAKRLPKIRAGRNLIVFYFRRDMEAVTAGIERRKTDIGTMKVSSAALTALDLLRYPQASGGIDNVATVLSDLGQQIDPEQLAALSAQVERAYSGRSGTPISEEVEHRFWESGTRIPGCGTSIPDEVEHRLRGS